MSGRREIRTGRSNNTNSNKKLNWIKLSIVILIVTIAIVSVVILVINKDKVQGEVNKENKGIAEKVKNEQNQEPEYKSIDKMLDEFGGEILEQVNSDTYYISKDGKTYTAYVNDEIVEGKIVPWNGQSTQPAVDEAGNINIYTAEELKWIADQVIKGEKNFSGVTITLRQHIDLSGRKNKEGIWEGKQWASVIGFLDELQKKEENKSANKATEQQIEDESIEITNENLKRFAGVFDGNGFCIRGLYINISKRYQGLFGISSGVIQNLTIKNSSINGGNGTGAVVGINDGKIINCRIHNTEVTGVSKIGGIVGIAMSGSYLENCSSSDSCIISGGDYTGGIAGYVNNNSSIRMCENEAIISGNNFVGGALGVAFYGTSIENTVNRSNCIIGEKYVGGIVGYSRSSNRKM